MMFRVVPGTFGALVTLRVLGALEVGPWFGLLPATPMKIKAHWQRKSTLDKQKTKILLILGKKPEDLSPRI